MRARVVAQLFYKAKQIAKPSPVSVALERFPVSGSREFHFR